DVEHDRLGAHTGGEFGRVGTHDAAAEDHDFAAPHAGHAAQENALAAVCFCRLDGGDLDRHPAGDLAHRLEQRQLAVVGLDRLVGDGGDLPLQKGLGQGLVGGEVEVRVDGLAFLHQTVFGRDRLLHLDDHVRPRPDVGGFVDDLPAHRLVRAVRNPAADACVLLDQDRVAATGELFHAAWHQADSIFAL